jgi:hypothetical protein
MRTSIARISLAAAGLAVVGLVGGAHAATTAPAGPKTLTYTDPSGDGKVAGDDITKVTYTTTGTTTKVGKKVTYTPKNLVIIVEAASAIVTNGTMQYDIEGSVPGCGDFFFYFAPGAAIGAVPVVGGAPTVSGSCADDSAAVFDGVTAVAADKTLTFTIGLGSITGFTAGASVTGMLAYTGTVDPVFGVVGPVVGGSAPLGGTGLPGEATSVANDVASSTDTYKIG